LKKRTSSRCSLIAHSGLPASKLVVRSCRPATDSTLLVAKLARLCCQACTCVKHGKHNMTRKTTSFEWMPNHKHACGATCEWGGCTPLAQGRGEPQRIEINRLKVKFIWHAGFEAGKSCFHPSFPAPPPLPGLDTTFPWHHPGKADGAHCVHVGTSLPLCPGTSCSVALWSRFCVVVLWLHAVVVSCALALKQRKRNEEGARWQGVAQPPVPGILVPVPVLQHVGGLFRRCLWRREWPCGGA